MKHIYLIDRCSIASRYGVGTYIQTLLDSWEESNQLRMTWIKMEANVKEVTEEWDAQRKIRVINLPSVYNNVPGQEKYYARNIAYTLATYINSNEENVFHFQFQNQFWLAERLKQLFPRCKLLMTVHYLTWAMELKGNRGLFKYILSQKERDDRGKSIYASFMFERRIFALMDQLICLSDDTLDILLTEYEISKDKILLIPNGLRDEGNVLDTQERIAKKQFYGFTGKDKIVLWVGRLESIKGLDILLSAFREVVNSVPEARLLIVGGGNYENYLPFCTGKWNKILFTGELDKSMVYELYQIADVGVISSYYEQCCYVAIEMMMHSLPVVGKVSGGLSDLIFQDWIVPDINRGKTYIAKHLIRLLTNEEDYKCARVLSRETFCSSYTSVQMYSKIETCYRNL